MPADAAKTVGQVGGLAVEQEVRQHVGAQLGHRAALRSPDGGIRRSAVRGARGGRRGRCRGQDLRGEDLGRDRGDRPVDQRVEAVLDGVRGGRVQEGAQLRHAVLPGFDPHAPVPQRQPVALLLGLPQQTCAASAGEGAQLGHGAAGGPEEQLVDDPLDGLDRRPLLRRETGGVPHQLAPQLDEHPRLPEAHQALLERLEDLGQGLREQHGVLDTAQRGARGEPEGRTDLIGHVPHRLLSGLEGVRAQPVRLGAHPERLHHPALLPGLLLQLPEPVEQPVLAPRGPGLRAGLLDQRPHAGGELLADLGQVRLLPEGVLQASRRNGGGGHGSWSQPVPTP